MTRVRVPASEDGVAKAGAQPPTEPQQEEKKPRERKPIHPGLDVGPRCRKCGTFLTFEELALERSGFAMRPFQAMFTAFCDCGVWTRDQRNRIRWIRYSSGLVEIGGGEVFAP